MHLVDTNRLFLDIDVKLFPMITEVTHLIKELKDGMEKNGVSPALPIENDRFLAEPMLDMMAKMSKFIDDYREIKDAWNVTIPSLDDEK